jgi:hypothetical protein
VKNKVTTIVRRRDAKGHWLKGVSGNEQGRPRTALSDLCRQQITKHGLVAVLGSIAARSGAYSGKTKIPISVTDQIQAIKLLLAYGYGMPTTEIQTGQNNVKIEVLYETPKPPINCQPVVETVAAEVVALSRPIFEAEDRDDKRRSVDFPDDDPKKSIQ